MKRLRITAAIGTLVLLAACGSGGQSDARSSSSSPPSSSASPTAGVQSAIPDGIYRTRPRTVQDLVALGLTEKQIDFAKKEEHWTTTIVYELRIKGDSYLLTATSDGGTPYVADWGTITARGATIDLFTNEPQDGYEMRFSLSNGVLAFALLRNPCKKIHPEWCSDFLVKAAYVALPFEEAS